MPRKGGVVKRPIIADLKYHDAMVSRFINGLMRRGKKSVAQRVFYNSLEIIGQRTKEDPLKVFHQAMDNVKPMIEVKSRRVGGATYQVPVEVRQDRRVSLAIRWIIGYRQGSGRKIHGSEAGRGISRRLPEPWAAPSKNGKTLIKWPKPTRPSPIIAGRYGTQNHSPGARPQYRFHGAH